MSDKFQLLLLGKKLSHSFSKAYFDKKFADLQIPNWDYQVMELETIETFQELKSNPYLIGCNVTVPYKTQIIPFLDEMDDTAKTIGAVNTVVREKQGVKTIFKGYNTDAFAFETTLRPLSENIKQALILGNGGAAKAVRSALDKLNIPHFTVSRGLANNFDNFNTDWLKNYTLIVNCTPLGMYPMVDSSPKIPYQCLNSSHVLYDLVYNPTETLFLKNGKKVGCQTINGLDMLYLQADKSFDLWRKATEN